MKRAVLYIAEDKILIDEDLGENRREIGENNYDNAFMIVGRVAFT